MGQIVSFIPITPAQIGIGLNLQLKQLHVLDRDMDSTFGKTKC